MKRQRSNRSQWYRIFYVLAIPVALFLLFMLTAPGFGLHSVPILLSQSLLSFVMALGMSFIMSTGIFDLSCGTQVMVVSLFAANMSLYFGAAGFFLGAIVAGLAVSSFVGLLYRVMRIPSIVLSLGMVMVLEYISRLAAGRLGAISIASSLSRFGKPPFSYMLAGIAVVVFCVLYYRTKVGSHLKLVGDNELVAIQIGVNVPRTKFLAYFCCGIFSGIAAILNVCYSGTISAMVGMASMSAVFRPMMAVMIAMTLANLYSNYVVDLFISVISVIIIFNGVIALGIPSNLEQVILGGFMLIVLVLTGNVNFWKEGMRRRGVANALRHNDGGTIQNV